MVNSGEIYGYGSRWAGPILHQAGETAGECMGTKHWWRNADSVPVNLTIGDIVNDKKPAMMEKMM